MLLADTTMPCGAVAVFVAVIADAVTGGACDVHATPNASAEMSALHAARRAVKRMFMDPVVRVVLPSPSSRLADSPTRRPYATRLAFFARCTIADAVSPPYSVTSVISGEAPSRKGMPQ